MTDFYKMQTVNITPEFEEQMKNFAAKLQDLVAESFGPNHKYVFQGSIGEVGFCIVKHGEDNEPTH
jgi:hypothetical protein